MSSNFLNDENKGDIIIYQSESGETKIDVRFQDETVWLTQAQMEELFQSSHANVVEHIKNIYSEGELDESSTCRKFRQVLWAIASGPPLQRSSAAGLPSA